MKKNINIILLFGLLIIGSTSCYKEPDLISDISKSLGKVPQISVVWLGSTRSVAASTAVNTGLTTTASAATFINVEFTSLVPVKEFRVYWAATASGAQTLISTTPAGTQKYDAALRQYAIAIPITAQDTKGTTRVFFAEIVGADGLVSAQKSAVLTTSK